MQFRIFQLSAAGKFGINLPSSTLIMVDGMKNKKWSVLESPSSVSELGEFRTIYDSNLVFACSKDSLKTTYD